jgi:DNA-binding MarR family transcriptional regulator
MIIDSNHIPPHLGGSIIKALCHLAEAGETRATDLAKLAGFSTAAATGLLDRGEKLGLMARGRTADDRRVVTARITLEGRGLVDKLKPRSEAAA